MPIGDLRANCQRGVTYAGVLLGVALIGVGLSVTATVWSKEVARQRKAEAEWVLAQYERALKSYYNAAPGSTMTLPESLDELLLDQRHLGLIRHLRRSYNIHCREGLGAILSYKPMATAVTLFITCSANEDPLASKHFSVAKQ